MAVNKVVYAGKTIMDVTGDTVTSETLAEGATATNAAGEKILGTMKAGSQKRSCRFVIGTSTAGWTEADCDYLCDGTADDVEFNAAIQALPITGGEIRILDGTYHITETIIVNKSNVIIEGNGISTVLLAEPKTSTNFLEFIILQCQQDFFTVSKVKFFTNTEILCMLHTFKQGEATQGIKIKDCIFEGHETNYCIALNSINSVVEGCGIDDNPHLMSVTLMFRGKSNNIIKNNYSIHTYGDQYSTRGISSIGTHDQFIGNYGLGIVMRTTCNSIIQSNICPIVLTNNDKGTKGANKNNIIVGNIIQNQEGTYETLDMQYLSNSIVTGNILKEIKLDTVERNNIVSDNILISTENV